MRGKTDSTDVKQGHLQGLVRRGSGRQHVRGHPARLDGDHASPAARGQVPCQDSACDCCPWAVGHRSSATSEHTSSIPIYKVSLTIISLLHKYNSTIHLHTARKAFNTRHFTESSQLFTFFFNNDSMTLFRVHERARLLAENPFTSSLSTFESTFSRGRGSHVGATLSVVCLRCNRWRRLKLTLKSGVVRQAEVEVS